MDDEPDGDENDPSTSDFRDCRLAPQRGALRRLVLPRGFDVTALDYAPEVVAAGRELARDRGLEIVFDHGDAEALAYADAAFDAVISTFGVMFVQRPEDAAAQLARVCRPGGRLAPVDWTPDGNVLEMFRIMKPFLPAPAGASPPDLDWASGNPHIARAVSRWAAAVDRVGASEIPERVRQRIAGAVAAWWGEDMPLGRAWMTPHLVGLTPAEKAAARVGLVTALAPPTRSPTT